LTPAVVVGAIRYGETSRIVRLATRDMGVQSAIAKGVSRPKSRFGASLQLMAEGTAHLTQGGGDLLTLTAFDVQLLHTGLAKSLENFRAASALAELVGRFVPGTAQEDPWRELLSGLRLLEASPRDASLVAGLTVLWRMIDALGVAPALTQCARDGEPVLEEAAVFSFRDGGVLCGRCGAESPSPRLPADELAAIGFFLTGEGEPPVLEGKRGAAHRRLLSRWVAAHLADGELPALELWRRGQ
jgi:DNA repair protein RecO (recombination protein O)